MAENLWRWHRRQAVVAISLLSASWASAQDTPSPNTPEAVPAAAASTALRDLRLSALSKDNKIAVDWRFVSDGKSIKARPERTAPEISISGIKTKKAKPSPFADQSPESIIIVLLSGRNKAELEYMRATSAAAVTALPDGPYRILIGIDGPDFKWAKDTQVSSAEQLPALFAEDLIAGIKPARKAATLTTGYAAALTALKSASPRARAAILVPEPLLPQNQNLLARLSTSAFTQRVSFFPVAPKGGVSTARAQNMIDLAGPTGGRFLPDALDGRPLEERQAMFSEFRGGASQVFTVKKRDLYRMPFEAAKPAKVVINYGDLTDNLDIAIDRKPLSGMAFLGARVNPFYWGNWLFTPGRRLWGFTSLALWLLTLGIALRLLFPPVRLYVQIAGEEKVQKIRRLPAIIGRSPDKAIHLGHEGVSREHAIIESNGPQIRIRDLDSTNGTFIAGEKVSKVLLRAVQTVQIGPVKIILRTKN